MSSIKAAIYSATNADDLVTLFNKTLDDFLGFSTDKFKDSGIDVVLYRSQVSAAVAVKRDVVIRVFGESVLPYMDKVEAEDRDYFAKFDVSVVTGEARNDASMVVNIIRSIKPDDAKFVFHYMKMLCYIADRYKQLAK